MTETIHFFENLLFAIRQGTDDHLALGHEGYLDSIMWVPSGGVFVDVGAHVGHFSIRLARQASKVYAFEPGQSQLEGLRRNIELNKLTNVEVMPYAVGATMGRVTTFVPKGGNNGQTRIESSPMGQIPLMPLDLALASIERLDLIKIDVQGAEVGVLMGAKEIIQKFHPRIMLELHDREVGDPSIKTDCERLLTQYGYTWKVLHENITNTYLACYPKEN